MKKIIIGLMCIILLLSLTSATDFTPQGNISLKSTYSILNGVFANFTQNVTASWFLGSINYSNVQNAPNLNSTGLIKDWNATGWIQNWSAIITGGGNPFNQSLNTTDKVKFNMLNVSGNDMYIGSANANHNIYFYDDSSPTNEYIQWNTGLAEFYMSRNLHAEGNIFGNADIYTTGAEGDLWLGTATQGSALFRAYATGQVNVLNLTSTNGIFSQGKNLTLGYDYALNDTDFNSSGLIKDWNASTYIRDWNATGLIRSWSASDWNSSGLIRDWNTSGYIKNWTVDIVSSNTSLKNWIDAQGYTSSALTWANAINGTLATWEQVMNGTVSGGGITWADAVNGTLANVGAYNIFTANQTFQKNASITNLTFTTTGTATTIKIPVGNSLIFTDDSNSFMTLNQTDYAVISNLHVTGAIIGFNDKLTLNALNITTPTGLNNKITLDFTNISSGRPTNCSAGTYVSGVTPTNGGVWYCATPTGTNNAHTHDGANISAGTILFARLPTLTDTHTHNALNITTPTGLNSKLTLDALNITSGTLSYLRLPTLSAGNITGGTFGTGNFAFQGNVSILDNQNITIGTHGFIYSNTSVMILKGSTSQIEVW